jgi:hypothetical protein
MESIKIGIQAMQESEEKLQEFTTSTCTDDVRLVNPDVGELRGLKACLNYSLVLFQTLPGFKLQVSRIEPEERRTVTGKVRVELELVATHGVAGKNARTMQGPATIFGLRPTGCQFSLPVVGLFGFEGSKITEVLLAWRAGPLIAELARLASTRQVDNEEKEKVLSERRQLAVRLIDAVNSGIDTGNNFAQTFISKDVIICDNQVRIATAAAVLPSSNSFLPSLPLSLSLSLPPPPFGNHPQSVERSGSRDYRGPEGFVSFLKERLPFSQVKK